MSGNVAIFFPTCLRNLGFRFYNENIPHQGRRMLKNRRTVRLGGGGVIKLVWSSFTVRRY